ncbi:hypothetical protein FIBSPDRAFT_883632 [Athelia psychrophila]|uniref:Secreted protein n=1 Tax=Athelia psychrophila TaxID=1759441 RepID=A0A166TRI4_9AGAM|nr:hypothetical protein FIBSPDRAFT_883632 [Fibularhizoctonia sp. CBS 109695]
MRFFEMLALVLVWTWFRRCYGRYYDGRELQVSPRAESRDVPIRLEVPRYQFGFTLSPVFSLGHSLFKEPAAPALTSVYSDHAFVAFPTVLNHIGGPTVRLKTKAGAKSSNANVDLPERDDDLTERLSFNDKYWKKMTESVTPEAKVLKVWGRGCTL